MGKGLSGDLVLGLIVQWPAVGAGVLVIEATKRWGLNMALRSQRMPRTWGLKQSRD